MNCPYCNAQNDDSADRCTSCLKHLPHVDVFPAQTTQAPALLEPSPPYKPNGPIVPAAAMRLIATGIVAAVVVAVVHFAVSRLLELFILFPMIAGLVTGAIMGRRIQQDRIRNVPLVVVCSLAAGLLTWGGKLACDAYSLRPQMVEYIARDIAAEAGVPYSVGKDQASRLLTPYRTIRLYVVLAASAGISLGHPGTKGVPIKGPFFWGIMVLDLVFTVGATMVTAIGEASTPFCVNCQSYPKTLNVFKKHPLQVELLVDMARRQNWEAARDLPIEPPTDDKNMAWLGLSACPTCGTGQVYVTSKVNDKSTTAFNADLDAAGVAALRAAEEAEATPASGATAEAS